MINQSIYHFSDDDMWQMIIQYILSTSRASKLVITFIFPARPTRLGATPHDHQATAAFSYPASRLRSIYSSTFSQ